MDQPSRLSPRQLAKQLLDVLCALPAMATSPLYRRRHLRQGATQLEVDAQYPGDDQVVRPKFAATRAMTIDVPPAAVWPWLVQVGAGRAGFYSLDLLDSLGRPSATTIVPQFQNLELGQLVPLSPRGAPTPKTSLVVRSFVADEWLLWDTPDSTWFWRLSTTASGGTRVVTRIRATYDWKHPVMAAIGVLLMELGDFAMMREMLRGINDECLTRVGIAELSGMLYVRPERDDTAAIVRKRGPRSDRTAPNVNTRATWREPRRTYIDSSPRATSAATGRSARGAR